ncbi:MAG: hypothetical protein ACT4PW_00365 [Acidimicrobiia bacterium]
MYAGFKDPKSFTNKMEFVTLDKPGLKMQQEWKEAKIIDSTNEDKFPEDDLWLRIGANVAVWQEVASGSIEGGKALMAGKIKFQKGPMSAAIENGGAFNNYLRAWGNVDTDWDV